MIKKDVPLNQDKEESGLHRETPEEDDDKEEEERTICCTLCYCSADYSDKSYFCQKTRDADSDLEGEQPKLLPMELYDPHNALVFCDSCDRPYHQLMDKTLLKNKLYQMEEEIGDLEQRWEFEVRAQKIVAFKAEIRRLRGGLSQQMQNIRLAQMSLKAYTTGRRTFSTVALMKSQELSQTVTKLNSAKLRVRQLLKSLEKYMKGDDVEWIILMDFLKQNPSEAKAWFPFGQKERRQQPRLRDEESTSPEPRQNGIPKHINLDAVALLTNQNKKLNHSNSKPSISGNISAEDDDSGISLDDLKCCICFRGEATDEIMCDGVGCFRAYHMHCLSPVMTPEKAEAEDDWFCPICTALAKLVAEVQSEYTGDEWHNDEDGSITSWDHVDDVFPEAEKEYEMTMKWKNNQIDEETKKYLISMFGDDNDMGSEIEEDKSNLEILGEDDDEDDDFDPEQKTLNDNDSVSNHDDDSSNATLQDLSSVEMHIEQRELNALSEGGSSDSDSDKNDEGSISRRRSRRIRSARSSRANTDDEETEDENKSNDIGALHESNILQGKRRRRKINYRLLNDSMFGKLSTKEKKNIDDQDDFQYKAPVRSASSSCLESDNSSEGSTKEEVDTGVSTTNGVSDDDVSEDQQRDLGKKVEKLPAKKRQKIKRRTR
eukprot:CAMPEP_0178931208 /NCGR_PEP_ID=MMETSP0786-20121207/21773_1 /TAXON_ID=186022 /ORGANISM="Thalassionema frauenfeldii, Strain CCMP 1798" /LENGTH=657 /DNA_ID=CAMNT_0020608041 /DNA_START=38 /DNA_END=2012 /DNA_ORIENTATION=+